MDKVQQFRQDLKEVLKNFAGQTELTEENLHTIERWIDKYIHEKWVVLGSFHIKCIFEDGKLLISPDNLFTAVLLETGRVKMDKLEEDRYDDESTVWLWRDKAPYKCAKPENPHKLVYEF